MKKWWHDLPKVEVKYIVEQAKVNSFSCFEWVAIAIVVMFLLAIRHGGQP